jgi:hypothetical protein
VQAVFHGVKTVLLRKSDCPSDMAWALTISWPALRCGSISESGQAMSYNPTQAAQWTTQLFEPTDILEIRCFPSKTLIEKHAPSKYRWDRTRNYHDVVPWLRASKIETILPILKSFNSETGVATIWGRHEENGGLISDLIDGIRLNIYCSANPRNGIGGRKSTDVALARSLFADLEECTLEEATVRRDKANLPMPSVTILSGHGVHYYWRLREPMNDLRRWKTIQKQIIIALRSDPYVHDPARMMRLPGFMNVNKQPAPCVLVQSDVSVRYSAQEIAERLPEVHVENARKHEVVGYTVAEAKLGEPATLTRTNRLERAIAYLDKCRRPKRGERNSRVFDLCANLTQKFGLDALELVDLFERFNQTSDDPLDDGELEVVVQKAHRHVFAKKQPTEVGDLEAPEKTGLPVIDISEWRSQMVASRLESLKQAPAVYFDRSPTGAGKSTADLEAMNSYGESVTILPTHEGIEEVVQKLHEGGLSTAGYPPINAETCQRFGSEKNPGDARIAQNAGLNVGEALCPDCKFAKNCTYQLLREKARTARHSVCTHARASSSAFDAIGDRSLVFIHENCIDLLRPTVRVADARRSRIEPSLADLLFVRQLAQHALALVSGWKDQEKIDFFAVLHQATEELANYLQPKPEAPPDQQEKRAVRLPLRQPHPRPKGCDFVLFRAMETVGVRPHGNALQLCQGHACGELHDLALVNDEFFAKGGPKRLQRALVGVWRVDPPAHARIWFEDATGNLEILSRLVGRPIQDCTPQGQLQYAVPPVQFPDDVTRRTSGNIVRGMIRGLLTLQPDARKVGIITHKCHVPEIERLEPFWKDRLLRLDYFGSGNDRGSNAWLDCDLLVILGTPRVPPSAVRERLVQIGNLETAALDGQWGVKTWQGRDLLGEKVVVRGSGYKNPAWQEAHETLVADALRQALGRGRGLLTEGITVIVVSNERLGLVLADKPLPLVKDQEALTLQAVIELSTENANSNILAKTVVSTSELAQHIDLGKTQTKQYLLRLTSLGLLKRKGERGGWFLPSPNSDLGAPRHSHPDDFDSTSALIMDGYGLVGV